MKLFDVKLTVPENFMFASLDGPLSVVAGSVADASIIAVDAYNARVTEINTDMNEKKSWQILAFADASHLEEITTIRKQVFTEIV